MKAFIKKMMILLMWYPLRATIKFLPLRLIYSFGIFGGQLLYATSKDKRNIMAEELRLVFPHKDTGEIEEIIKGSLINYVVSEIEVLLYPLMNREFIKKVISIEGKEHLDNALSKGRGVLLFQAHFGAFQVVMPAIGYSGYKMNQISASATVWKDGSTSRIQKKSFDIKAGYEYSLPVRHMSIRSSLRPVFRALERNEIVGITVDGGGGKKVTPIRFLGRNANFQQGAADMALRTGAEIVPAFIITKKGLKHRLIIHPPLKVNQAVDRDRNTGRILMDFAAILGRYVYQHPTHYGYSLYLRKSRAPVDPYPFFSDYDLPNNSDMCRKLKAVDYV